MRQWVAMLGLVFILAACAGPASEEQAGTETDNTNVSAEFEGSIIRWPRDANFVVFRMNVVGGENTEQLYRLNDVPLCSVYGDGRVVWTAPGPGGLDQVLFDFLEDSDITNFISYLTVIERIYTYPAGFDLELPSSTQPVYEQMQVNVNDIAFTTDVFSNWPEAYFSRILERCRSLSSTPTIFEPTGAWLSAEVVDYNPSVPSAFWETDAAGLSFLELALNGERRWIEGNVVRIIWNQLRTNAPDLQFSDGTDEYRLALQVPGVTIDAPPAPAQ